MTFLNGVYIGILLVVYLGGVVLSGKFYRLACKSEVLPFEPGELEFLFSVFWFFTIPIYFAFLLVYGVFASIWLVYDRYV